MQQLHLDYPLATRSVPRTFSVRPLLWSPLAAGAALLLFYGHWMLLILTIGLGLSLLYRLQQLTRPGPDPQLNPIRLKPVDGGLSSGQPTLAQPFTRSAVVADGGSFERAL